jgi:hypothetical protein
MTEPLPPPDDQLVSDHLDGVAEDPAAVPSGESGRIRLEQFTEARDRVAADVPVPAAAREAAVAAAQRAFDRERPSSADAGDAGPSPVVAAGASGSVGAATPDEGTGDELAARRRRRWRAAPLIGAAASVLLVVGLIAGVQREQQGDQATSGQAPVGGSADRALPPTGPGVVDAAGGQADSGAAAPSGQGTEAGTPLAAGALPTDLGTVDDAPAFRRAVVAVTPRLLLGATSTMRPPGAAPVTAEPAAALPCDGALRAAHPELGAVALRSVAHREGATLPVVAFLVPAPPPAPPQTTSVRAFLVDPVSCRVVFDETV